MRGRSTIILLVLAAGLGAYLYFIDAKKPVIDEKAKQKVFTADATKIDRLDVKSASGDVTSLKKDARRLDHRQARPVAGGPEHGVGCGRQHGLSRTGSRR